MRYDVTIDYVTTTTIVVEAEDEHAAHECAYRYCQTKDGQDDLLRRMNVNRNVPDGFEVAYVCEAMQGAPLLYATRD